MLDKKMFLTLTLLSLGAVIGDSSVNADTVKPHYKIRTIDGGKYYKASKKPRKKHNIEIPTQIHHLPKPAPQPVVSKAVAPARPNLKSATGPQQPNAAQQQQALSAGIVDSNIARNAERMVGYFNYGQVRPVQNYVTKPGHQLNTVDDVDPNGITDCSGFVWLTLRVSGYNVGGFPAGSTENMKHLDGGWGSVLEEIPQNQAQPGDIVVVSASMADGGHTGILDGSYNGNDLVNSDTPFINVSDGTHACKRGPIKWYFATLKYKAPTHVYRVKPSAHLGQN